MSMGKIDLSKLETTEWDKINLLEAYNHGWQALGDIDLILPPYIYVSGVSAASSKNLLEKHMIRVVVNLGPERKATETLNMYNISGIKNFDIIMPDDDSKSDIFSIINDFQTILTNSVHNKKNVLVHCDDGVSKAPAMLAYYILKELYQKKPAGLILEKILESMKKKRKCIEIHSHLKEQLKRAESVLSQIKF